MGNKRKTRSEPKPEAEPVRTAADKGRDSFCNLPVKLRQVWTRRGFPVFSITISGDTLDKLGWEPGMYLQPYITDERELVFVELNQGLKHLSPDYDLEKGRHPTYPRRGPRPNSLTERSEQLEEHYKQMEERVGHKEFKGTKEQLAKAKKILSGDWSVGSVGDGRRRKR